MPCYVLYTRNQEPGVLYHGTGVITDWNIGESSWNHLDHFGYVKVRRLCSVGASTIAMLRTLNCIFSGPVCWNHNLGWTTLLLLKHTFTSLAYTPEL